MKRRLNKKLGKKAMMDDLFDFLFTVFTAFFALMFVHAIFSGQALAQEEAALWHLERVNTDELLRDYLQAPYLGSHTLGDLVLLRAGDKNYDALYKEETKKFLEPFQTEEKSYAVFLYQGEQGIADSCAGSEKICQEVGKLPPKFQLEHLGEKEYSARTILPVSEKEVVTISLRLVKK